MFLGFDPSLTSSGFAYRMEGDIIVGRIVPKGMTGVPRLLYLREMFGRLLNDSQATVVAYEGYSMGSHIGRAFDIGELGGVLKTYSIQQGISMLIVPPTVLKKFITGKGNAAKPEISTALGLHGLDVTQNDEADALALLLLAERYFSHDLPANDPLRTSCLYLGTEVINAY
jgi:Holliday junction resolvasome RuvABC endonuclease subunit